MQNEKRATTELIKLALEETDEDARWNYITVLHMKGNEEVFEISKSLCESGDAKKIMLGADILGQLGTVVDLPFKNQSIPILLRLSESNLASSESEEDIDALHSVISALGRMQETVTIRKISEFQDHQSALIREGVAVGLLFTEEEFAIKILIKLSNDSGADVRNWATFGLGQREDDTQEIRDALFQRFKEDNSEIGQEIFGEALVGLARRKDERVIEPLLKQLSSDSVGVLDVEAALEVADERFCDALRNLKSWWDLNENLLNEAINNCCEPENRKVKS